MSCLRLHSRASVPTAPRKYLVVTIVEAFTDQKSGNSTPRCSKTVSPVLQFVCTTSRRSQVTSSYGCAPLVLNTRSMCRPSPTCHEVLRCFPGFTVSVMPTSSPLILSILVCAAVSLFITAGKLVHPARALPHTRAGWSVLSGRGPRLREGLDGRSFRSLLDRRLVLSGRPTFAEAGDLGLEILGGLERAVDAREPQVGDLVELPKWLEDRQPDLVGRNLGLASPPQLVLDLLP